MYGLLKLHAELTAQAHLERPEPEPTAVAGATFRPAFFTSTMQYLLTQFPARTSRRVQGRVSSLSACAPPSRTFRHEEERGEVSSDLSFVALPSHGEDLRQNGSNGASRGLPRPSVLEAR